MQLQESRRGMGQNIRRSEMGLRSQSLRKCSTMAKLPINELDASS